MASNTVIPIPDAIAVEHFIAVPPARVFQAITDPAQIIQWWGQPGTYRTSRWHSDLRPGGHWRSEGINGNGSSFHVSGEYLEIDPPRLLEHTWQPSWESDLKTTVRWELTAKDNGTLVKIQHSGFAGKAKAAQDHGNGWRRVLGWMQAFVEQGSTIDSRK